MIYVCLNIKKSGRETFAFDRPSKHTVRLERWLSERLRGLTALPGNWDLIPSTTWWLIPSVIQAFFWSLQTPDMLVVHGHICRQNTWTNTKILKTILCPVSGFHCRHFSS